MFPGPVQEASSARILSVLVAVCHKIEEELPLIDLSNLNRELAKEKNIVVETNSYLCGLKGLADLVRSKGAKRLVLCLCSKKESLGKVQTECRKAGLDPFGVEVIDLEPFCRAGNGELLPSARAILIIKGAVERVRAFTGSRPENLKSRFFAYPQKLSRRELFSFTQLTYFPLPTVDRNLCKALSGCDYCVRSCPHDVLQIDEGNIRVEREKCPGCGICAAQCPWRAIEFPKWSPGEMETQISALLKRNNAEPRPLLFVCHRATVKDGRGWLPIRVPCQSFVTVPLILRPLSHGATTIGIYSCGERCITGRRGKVADLVDFCRKLLESSGESPDRVKVVGSEAGVLEPPPKFSNIENRSSGSICLFGRDAIHGAIRDITRNYKLDNLELEHPSSPLGIVEINPQTCTVCGTCAGVCPTGSLSCRTGDGEMRLEFTASFCIGCSRCVSVCPERRKGAISVRKMIDLAAISQGPRILSRAGEVLCKKCGKSFATDSMIQRLKSVLGENFRSVMGALCSNCRGLPYR